MRSIHKRFGVIGGFLYFSSCWHSTLPFLDINLPPKSEIRSGSVVAGGWCRS